MMEARLQTQFGALAQILRRTRLWRALASRWAVAAAVGLALFVIQSLTGREFHLKLWVMPLTVGMVLAGIVFMRPKQQANDTLDLIRNLEPHQPEVRHLLSAAAEQRPAGATDGFSFLQLRAIEEALAHPRREVWRRQLEQRLAFARIGHAGALMALLIIVLALTRSATHGASGAGPLLGDEIAVTPGDTEVERGTGLVIAARFGGAPPAEATLVLNFGSDKESRIPMARRLADPVFGASIPEVSQAGVYHIEYGRKKTRDYRIAVFEFPALVRADAQLRYPAYTGLTNRTIPDTLRVSAVEGSRLSYTLLLNKPVAKARWVGKEHSLVLAAQTNAAAVLPDFLLITNARYALELTDAEGRTNKFPTDFVLQALTNQRPDLKLLFPRGDPRVSRLEELELQAEASDDFGLLKYGVGFGVAGQEPKFIELGRSAPAQAKRQFDYLIPLEKLGVDVDQSVTYFAWADDYGPDGQPRRTFSDIFFADVRPFEEVFRPDQSGSGESGDQNGSQGGGSNERVRLADLQKQIVVATWNLQRGKVGAGGARYP
jgi:hypothetical protein